MSYIRQGLNKRNLEYWRDEVFIDFQNKDYDIASLMAYKVCSNQEIDKLKERIIKLEKKLTNPTNVDKEQV